MSLAVSVPKSGASMMASMELEKTWCSRLRMKIIAKFGNLVAKIRCTSTVTSKVSVWEAAYQMDVSLSFSAEIF